MRMLFHPIFGRANTITYKPICAQFAEHDATVWDIPTTGLQLGDSRPKRSLVEPYFGG